MNLRTALLASGVLGGLAWLLRTVLDLAGSTGGLVDVLHWVGLVLLALGLAGLGLDLVGKGVVWLRAIVAVAVPVLVWSILEAIDPGTDPSVVDGIAGLVVAVLAWLELRKAKRARAPKRRAGTRAR
ncbi:hypothetical protein ACFP3Q_02505 [Nocardioides sp. GCM10027113]|uniref:hypothetical protein n=1 Tax=unclassified Nocardioides TaxID=2615069 RepID=UPI003614C895